MKLNPELYFVIKLNCHDCDKQYEDKRSLKNHVNRVHKRVKYNCDQCEKEYADRRSLTNHMNSVHKGIKYKCKHCDKVFENQGLKY